MLHCQQHMLAEAFISWKHFMLASKQLHRSSGQVKQLTSHNSLKHAWGMWRRAHQQPLSLKKSTIHLQHSMIFKVLKHWQVRRCNASNKEQGFVVCMLPGLQHTAMYLQPGLQHVVELWPVLRRWGIWQTHSIECMPRDMQLLHMHNVCCVCSAE